MRDFESLLRLAVVDGGGTAEHLEIADWLIERNNGRHAFRDPNVPIYVKRCRQLMESVPGDEDSKRSIAVYKSALAVALGGSAVSHADSGHGVQDDLAQINGPREVILHIFFWFLVTIF